MANEVEQRCTLSSEGLSSHCWVNGGWEFGRQAVNNNINGLMIMEGGEAGYVPLWFQLCG